MTDELWVLIILTVISSKCRWWIFGSEACNKPDTFMFSEKTVKSEIESIQTTILVVAAV